MHRKSEIVKEGILVTIGSLVVMALSFLLYYLIFMLFEAWISRGTYHFVSLLRVGYGVVWIVLGPMVYRTRVPDWLKAVVLCASLTTFFAAIGVQLYEAPMIGGIVMVLVFAVGVWLLRKTGKKWYHYYAVVLSILAASFYLFPAIGS